MKITANQNLILIEGAATYERILTEVREVEIDEGIRHIKDFIKIYPDFARAHNDLAVMYYQTGNPLKALAHYEKAHKLDPSNITYRKNLADFYFVELEWTGDAIHSYLDILKDNPFDIESLNALGTISLHLGRREQARQYFNRTLQLDTQNQEARQALQQIPSPPDDSAAARQHRQLTTGAMPPPAEPAAPQTAPPAPSFQNLFNIVAAPAESSSEELHKEAMNLVTSDRPDEAINILNMLLGRDAGHALAHNDLGVLYQKAGELDKARFHHKEAVRLQPANPVFLKNLADLLCSSFGALEEALEIYVRLFAENRYDVEIIKAIAYICLSSDRLDDALFFLEQVLAIKPWDQEAAETVRTLKTRN